MATTIEELRQRLQLERRPASDKVPVHKLSHLEHRDDLLAVEYRQQLFVCADVALILGDPGARVCECTPKAFWSVRSGGVGIPQTSRALITSGYIGSLPEIQPAINTHRPSHASTAWSNPFLGHRRGDHPSYPLQASPPRRRPKNALRYVWYI